MPPPIPELRFDTAGNAQISLNVLAGLCGTGRARVVGNEVDATGKLRLSITLPGSETVRNKAPRR